jgi:hypothetical protein
MTADTAAGAPARPTMAEFITAVHKQGLDLDPIGAEELADVVRGIYALPEAAVEGVAVEGARELLPAL